MTKNTMTRRDFVRTAGYAGAAVAALSASPLAPAAEGEKLTLALVGGAHIHTPSFVNLLKNRKDVWVKWVWDHDAGRAQNRAQALNTRPANNPAKEARVAREASEVWSDPEVKAVVICSETNRHPELIAAAAKAGKHMFAEKPLGITARESFAMAKAIEEAGLLFTTGYFMRGQSHHLFLKEQVAAGAFGKITHVRGSNCHSGSLGGWFDTEWRWMADPKIAGVGAFGDLGTHSLDILMWLFGDVEEGTADIKVVTGRYGDCDESGEGLLRFKNGITATLAAGWVDVENPVSLLISGTEGHAVIMNNDLYFRSQKVAGANGKEPWDKLPKPAREPLHQFVDAVAGKKDQPLVTPREAAARVAVMEALYQGCQGRTWVKPLQG